MPDRDRYIPGVPCWADVAQPDPQAGAEFYSGLFGWETESVMPPDAPGKYFIGRIRSRDVGAVGSIPEGAPPTGAWNTYVWVESADETAAKVRDVGGSVLTEPFDIEGFGRMATFADPAGAAFSVWEAKEHKGSGVVNEHGSVNFNDLNTNDVEGAKAFYGAVFGWEALDLGGFEMWTLPGYGGHLEEINPGVREQNAELGAPEGFVDVVASLASIGDDQDTKPHWGVTFAVDNADTAAATATKLGGKVVMPPTDMPWVRATVITDPQGATFTASQFVPENKDPVAEPETASAGS